MSAMHLRAATKSYLPTNSLRVSISAPVNTRDRLGRACDREFDGRAVIIFQEPLQLSEMLDHRRGIDGVLTTQSQVETSSGRAAEIASTTVLRETDSDRSALSTPRPFLIAVSAFAAASESAVAPRVPAAPLQRMCTALCCCSIAGCKRGPHLLDRTRFLLGEFAQQQFVTFALIPGQL